MMLNMAGLMLLRAEQLMYGGVDRHRPHPRVTDAEIGATSCIAGFLLLVKLVREHKEQDEKCCCFDFLHKALYNAR